MKLFLFCIILFLSGYNKTYGQINEKEYFKSLTDNDKKTLVSIYQLKRDRDNHKFIRSLDSVKQSFGKSHKLYPLILTLSASENEESENYDKAILDYNELIRLLTESKIDILHLLSKLYAHTDNFNKSISILEEIIRLKPNENLAYTNLANKYIILRKHTKALKVLNSNPNNERAPFDDKFYAIIYFTKNKVNKAKEYIDRYLKNDFSTRDFRGYLIASKIYNKLNLNNESCDFINKAFEYSSTINLENSKLKKLSTLYKNIEAETKETKELVKNFCE